ncbi:sulfur oxidation c-type cytochrome SoxX [Acidithiobacillus sp. IBUN Pt1247-S3]|uniref:sulfur oxidation c-type cytochrome SoxX n=1 Tax=Acidithiobacillus sp. IBUN Pt1247-S3 TaxID=3166642 RepID=UPI0034E3A37D
MYRQTARILLLLGAVALPTAAIAAPSAADIAAGKSIAFNRAEGNCLACHVLPGGTMAGNVGPDLTHFPFKIVFHNRQKLVNFIYDPEKVIPHINMPQFGKNKVLTHHQIELVAGYLWSLQK